MRTTFPFLPQIFNPLLALLTKPETEIQEVAKSIESITVTGGLSAFIEEQSTTNNWNVISSLMTMFRQQQTLIDYPVTTSPYLDQVLTKVDELYRKQHNVEPDKTKIDILRQLLEQALSPKNPLGRMLKTNDLQTFNERNFSRIRIVSDIRPVFPSDEQVDDPIGALLVHNMNIVFQNHITGSFEDIFVVLETEELHEIKACVDRAIAKSEVLGKALEAFGSR